MRDGARTKPDAPSDANRPTASGAVSAAQNAVPPPTRLFQLQEAENVLENLSPTRILARRILWVT